MNHKTNSVLHNSNRPKYGLFCLSLQYKCCEQSYFHFWFQEGMKMLFVNKEIELFSLKNDFFPQNLLPDVFFCFCLIPYQNSNDLLPDLVQDDI